MTKDELLATVTFLETLRGTALTGLGVHAPDPYWNITLYLMRRHLEGKPIAITGLAAAALIPYGSAMRRIHEMIEAGLLFKRTRTASGRSFSIHPTPILIERFEASMERVKRLTRQISQGPGDDTFYFGGSYLGERIIGSPHALNPPIGRTEPIRILIQDDPTFQVVARFKREVQEWIGGPIELTVTKIDKVREETLANAHRVKSDYDIVAVDMPWTGEYVRDRVLLPLTPWINKGQIDFADFHATAWEAANFAGEQYAIPIQTTPELLMCRSDLLKKHGLPPPTTTEELLVAARELTSQRDERHGAAWRAGRGLPVAHSFVQFMASFGQPPIRLPQIDGEFVLRDLMTQELDPAFDTDAAAQAAEFMLRLRDVSTPRILEMDAEESIGAYAEGRAAVVYAWSCRASRFELDPQSPARGATTYLPHPHGPMASEVSPMGGYLLGIPANTEARRAQTAWRVISWLVSPEAMKFYVQGGSFASPRFSVSADPHVAEKCQVIGAVDQIARKGGIKLWPRPPAPDMAGMFAILGDEMHKMLEGRQTARVALRRSQDRTKDLAAAKRARSQT